MVKAAQESEVDVSPPDQAAGFSAPLAQALDAMPMVTDIVEPVPVVATLLPYPVGAVLVRGVVSSVPMPAERTKAPVVTGVIDGLSKLEALWLLAEVVVTVASIGVPWSTPLHTWTTVAPPFAALLNPLTVTEVSGVEPITFQLALTFTSLVSLE